MLYIDEVKGLRALKDFVQFQIELYKGVDAFVPPMVGMEVDLLDPKQNPAFEFCEAVFFVVRSDDARARLSPYNGYIGRVAGIINHSTNRITGRKVCRFCYCDFIDDLEVSRLLLDRVAEWGRSKGMDELEGPLGLTDLDYEGCLVDGFDQLATMVELYNHSYYPRHFEAYGMKPSAYWDGFRIRVPEQPYSERHWRVAEIARQRYGLKVVRFTSYDMLTRNYGRRIFELYNSAYAPIYGFSPITDRQIDYYINLYLKQLRLDLIRVVTDSDDNLLAFGFCTPSLSRAQQKARGHMFPFGWFHLARAVYLTRNSRLGRLLHGGTDTVDLMLIAVRPDMQGKGVNALLFTELIPQFIQNGYQWVETNNELETNHKVQNLWSDFNPVRHKRRCTFVKEI